MIRGLYIAGTGMNVQSKKMDIISNDLANVNTTGYKKDTAIISSFPEILLSRVNDTQNHRPNNGQIGKITHGAKIDEIYTEFTPGSVRATGGLVDIAIQGDGFFVVQTPNGEAYTRDGSFSIDASGNLVTKEGYKVMGENGPVALGEDFLSSGGEVTVGKNGDVVLDGTLMDTISIAKFTDNKQLQKLDDNLYQGTGQRAEFDGTLLQGFLETSNVNPVTAMVDMISVSRAYEANQKILQVHDALLGKAVNEIARV
ncbi:MAG: flagellar basal-body rod protein FlgF [Cellulosilyticaceae bacterium]